MAYRIEYLEEGNVIGTEVPGGSLAATQQAARMGMVERRAQLVRVVDIDSAAEIWSETVLAS
jgi:hypothetical protein